MQGKDSTGSGRHPGDDYEYDWAGIWPGGSGDDIKRPVNGFVPGPSLDFGRDRYFDSNAKVANVDDLVDFTIPGPATFVDADGLVIWNAHNLALWSEDFSNAVWIDGAILAATRVDGSLTLDNAEGYAYVKQENTIAETATIIIDVDVTCDTTVSKVPIRSNAGAAVGVVLLDVVAGVTQRISLTLINAAAGAAQIGLDARNGVAPGGSNEIGYTVTFDRINIQRADLGGVAPNPFTGGDYIKTEASQVYLPRIGHHAWDGTKWVPAGIRLESEDRTNTMLDSATWASGSTTRCTRTIEAGGPIGELSEVTINSEGNFHFLSSSHMAGIMDTGIHTTSVVFEYIDQQFVQMTVQDSGTRHVNIDIKNGVLGDTGVDTLSAGIVPFGPNQWLVWHTHNQLSTNFYPLIAFGQSLTDVRLPQFTGDGVSKFRVSASQVEPGNTPSSYIPTTVSAVTRLGEDMSMPALAALPGAVMPAAVSLAIDGLITHADDDLSTQARLFSWGGVDRIEHRVQTSVASVGQVVFLQSESGVNSQVFGPTDAYIPGVDSTFKTASRNGATFINGAHEGSLLTESNAPVALVDLSSTPINVGPIFMGSIKSFRFWDEDIEDAGIVEATNG